MDRADRRARPLRCQVLRRAHAGRCRSRARRNGGRESLVDLAGRTPHGVGGRGGAALLADALHDGGARGSTRRGGPARPPARHARTRRRGPRPVAAIGLLPGSVTQADMLSIKRVLAPNPSVYTLEGTNTWIVGSEPTIVIDPGPDLPQHLADVAREAGSVGAVLVTHDHPDHSPGAIPFARLVDAPVYASRLAGAERLSAGQRVRAGDLELATVQTPGHTSDHVAFFDLESGALFTGDTVLGRGTSFIDPPDGDLVQYLRSLRRLLDLDPRSIYPGHGPVVAASSREAPRVPRAPRGAGGTGGVGARGGAADDRGDGPGDLRGPPRGGASTRRSLGAGAAAQARRRGAGRTCRQGRRRTVDRFHAEDVPAMRTPGQGQGAVLRFMRLCDAAVRRVRAARSRRTTPAGPGIGRARARRDRRRRAPRGLGSRSPAWIR